MKQPTNYDPQAAVLYCLTDKPELIHSVDLDYKWFSDPKLRVLAQYLIEKDGSIKSYIELRGDFDSVHAGVLSREDWDRVLNGELLTARVVYWANVLHKDYLRNLTRIAANEYTKQPTTENLNTVIENAQAIAKTDDDTHEVSLQDMSQDMERRLNGEVEERAIKTWIPLNNAMGGGLMGGRLITIGARPAVGKSAFTISLIMSALKQQPSLSVDLFSLEMSNVANYRRFVSYITGIQGGRLVNPAATLQQAEADKVRAATQQLQGYDLRLYERQTRLSTIVQTIRTRAAAASEGYIAVVDYLQLIDVNSKADRRLQIEQITRQLKQLTNELNIPIVMLSQLSRGITQRQDPAPMLSDLRESGSIEQDSNAVMFLYNEKEPEPSDDMRLVTLKVAKNREGSLADINFKFYPERMRFEVKYI